MSSYTPNGYIPDDFDAVFTKLADGQEPPDNPVPVLQSGEVVGHLPSGTSASSIRSNTAMYDVRRGDWTDVPGGIEANKMLGYGDLIGIVGFRPLR